MSRNIIRPGGKAYVFTAGGKEIDRYPSMLPHQAKKHAEGLADQLGGEVSYAPADDAAALVKCKPGDRAKSLQKSRDDEAEKVKAKGAQRAKP